MNSHSPNIAWTRHDQISPRRPDDTKFFLCALKSLWSENFCSFYNVSTLRLLLPMLLLMLLSACGNSESESEEAETAVTPIVEVKIDSIRLGAIPEVINATGMTKALRQENISSPIEGKVTKLRIFEGDAIKRGEVMALVNTKESLAALTGAELLLARAQTSEEKNRAAAALKLAQQNNTSLEIRAPFDGVVVARGLNEGEFVAAGGTLATVIDLRSLYFFAKVPARDLSRLKLGQTARVHFQSWPDNHFSCRVENIKPQIDPLGQMAEVRLRFQMPNPELRSEMFGNAEIEVGRHEQVLLVPDAAVLRDDETGAHTIVEAAGDSLGVIHEVALGLETPALVEISGAEIHPGMHILVEGHYGLPDSTKIHVVKE